MSEKVEAQEVQAEGTPQGQEIDPMKALEALYATTRKASVSADEHDRNKGIAQFLAKKLAEASAE